MTEIKSLQRMLAVQVLYQESINPNDDNFDINKTLMDAVETLKLNKLKMKPNLNFAKKIYSGVSTNNKAIDADILLALGSSHDFKKDTRNKVVDIFIKKIMSDQIIKIPVNKTKFLFIISNILVFLIV